MLRSLGILLFTIISGLSYAQTQTIVPDTSGPQFYFFNNDRAHDFGSIMINGNSEYRFEFKNSGTQPLIIKGMRSVVKGLNTPPYKVLINYPQSPIRPGNKGLITATVVAQGNTGSFKCEVLVNSNAAPPDYPLLLLTGAIVPDHGEAIPAKTEPKVNVEFLAPVIRSNTK